MTLIEHPVVSGDGHASVLRVHRPEAPRAGLLWLPALGVPAEKYDGLGLALAEAGVACAVHEWRGQSSSSWRARRGADWGYRELLGQDLPATIAGLDPALPWVFGGHSLGGQLAAMSAALQPAASRGLVLLATGVPHTALYTGRTRIGISLFARAIPVLTTLAGYYPGHRLGFAGREAGRLMRDWAATVRTGNYRDYGTGLPLDDALSRLVTPALGIHMSRDPLVPEASLQALLERRGGGATQVEVFDSARLGVAADHFRWMRQPGPVAAAIAGWMAGTVSS